MHNKFLIFLLIPVWLLAACSGAKPPTQAPVSPTLIQASTPTAPPTSRTSTPNNTPAALATAPPENTPPAENAFPFDPSAISLDVQGLASGWQAVLAPATPFDNLHAPGPSGLPMHIQIVFNQVTRPADREPGAPVIYLIPIDAYRQLWEEHESRTVSDLINRIARVSAELPDPKPVRGLPVLPLEETFGVNDFATQLRHPVSAEESASKTGFRFVGRFAMEAAPITNHGLRYMYQGFTNDGRFLVAFFYPVQNKGLPDDLEAVSLEDQNAFSADGLGYLAAKARELDKQTVDAWSPSLESLDALIASLQIADMPATALPQGRWIWVETVPSQAEDRTSVPSPESYQLTFTQEELAVKADCKAVQGAYEAFGGASGDLTIQLGPTTQQLCQPGSLADDFIHALSLVNRYEVLPGGGLLQLHLEDGSLMVFSNVQ